MSTRRRRTSSSKPRRERAESAPEAEPRPAADEPAEELESLEELDELEDLDALEDLEVLDELDEDSPVRVTHELGGGDADVVLTIDVGDLEKAAVTDAIDGPLRRQVTELGRGLRWKKVRVEFAGDAMIPSAAKDRVGAVLAEAKPLSVVVQRGFGDETVVTGEMPSVELRTSTAGDAVEVEVEAGDLDSEDLPLVLDPELGKLGAQAAGRSFEFRFSGAMPDDEVLEMIRSVLSTAGATRARCAGQILFDRELESRVQVRGGARETEIEVTPADDENETVAALSHVCPRCRGDIAGHRVTVMFRGRAPRDSELAKLVELARELGSERLELGGDAEPDLLHPPLLRSGAKGDVAKLGVAAGDRSRSAVVRAFQREAAQLGETIAGRRVTVDWPAGFRVDTELQQAVERGLLPHGPESLAFTFGGEEREPVYPPPVELRPEGDRVRLELDTAHAKPVELIRALPRRMPALEPELRGQHVDVHVAGGGAMPGRLQRAVVEHLTAAGVEGARVFDGESADVVLPPLLSFEPVGHNKLRVVLATGGRDAEQIARATSRELDEQEIPEGATFHIGPSDAAEAIAAEFAARGAGRVILEGEHDVQIHPPLFAPPEADGRSLTLRASPDTDGDALNHQIERELAPILAAHPDLSDVEVTLVWPGATEPLSPAVGRVTDRLIAAGPAALHLDDGAGKRAKLHPEEIPPPPVTVLGRRDEATPPMIMLGVAWNEDPDHVAVVTAELDAMAADIDGRRVLLVFRDADGDRGVRDDDPLSQAVRAKLASAAALLVFRAETRTRTRTTDRHFEVVASTLDALPVGAKMRDPRPS